MKSRRRNLREGLVRRSFVERSFAAAKGEKLEWLPETHVIKNICVLSPDSRNGRIYKPEAMADALKLYDGARAYANHPNDPTETRDVRDRIGRWHNPRIVEGKVRADLHYNPAHDYARTLTWAVQECPDHCGVSHNVEAEGYEQENGQFVVERLREVRSIDIVDDPATNRSLLESHKPRRRRKAREAMDPELEEPGMGEESPEHHLGAYISACCDDPNMDKAAKRKKILKALDLYDEPGEGGEMEEEKEGEPHPQEKEKADQYHGEIGVGEEEEPEEEEPMRRGREEGVMGARESYQAVKRLAKSGSKKTRALAEQLLRTMPRPQATRPAAHPALRSDPEYRRMAQRLDALETKEAVTESVRTAIQECKAAGLPKRVMSRLFIEDLAECTDRRRRRAMIQERAHLASISLPRSYGPGGVGGGPPKISDAEFAAMVDGEQD